MVYLPLERAAQATMDAIRATGDRMPNGPGELSPAACTTACLASWRMTQGIYRIDPTLYAALIDTPVSGDIPADVLLYLPEWCVYVETPGMTVPVRVGAPADVLGLWYWLDVTPGRDMILCIGIDTGRRPPLIVQHVPLVGTIDEAIAATLHEWEDAISRGNAANAPPQEYAAAARAWLPGPLSLILYLCSTAAEISGPVGNPEAKHTRRHGTRLYPAAGVTPHDVGVRLGAALRHAQQAVNDLSDGDGRHHVAPHVRRAHWATYWTGPKSSPQKPTLKWLPPIAVGVEDFDALPSVIHPVRP